MNILSNSFRSASRRPIRALVGVTAVTAVIATALPAYAANAGPSNTQRLALAKDEITSLFSAAPLPSGSRQITAAVAEKTKPFSGDTSNTYSGNEVGATKFFVAPSASASLTWLATQRLDGHAAPSQGTSGTTHTQIYLLSNTAVLEQPEVVYIASTRPNGTLEFSVTATVWWRSQKSASAAVASRATKLTVKLNRGLNAKTDRTSTATSDNKSQIASIIAHINALPVPSPLPMNCPNDVGASLTMSFYSAGAKTPYSVVVADPGGCGPVTISSYNADHVRTAAGDVAGGVALSKFVAAQLGLTNLNPA
jgi:hypothetical protein